MKIHVLLLAGRLGPITVNGNELLNNIRLLDQIGKAYLFAGLQKTG
jgi:hypothetical protein